MALNRKDMALSCVEWVKDFKRKRHGGHIPRQAGCIIIFFDEGEGGSGVCAGTPAEKERFIKELREVLRKLEERRIIFDD